MKVHPAPRKRNITFHYDVNRSLMAAGAFPGRQKKLRRLPHIFSKVLELPFSSDTDVDVHEDSSGFQFVVAVDDVPDSIRAHAIDIYPGVTKVVIRAAGEDSEILEDDLELDRWRFRLPPGTRPELAAASYVDGELVVSIPKGGDGGEGEDGTEDLAGGGVGRLVIVQ